MVGAPHAGGADADRRAPETVSTRIPLTLKYQGYLIGRVPTRLSRAEQVGRNRERVLDAARMVFLREGYAGARLDAIAEQAGFSKGVVYSQFAGKADLFLALVEARIAERAAVNARLAADGAGLDGLAALLGANERRSAEGGDWMRLLIEFRVVAARDPELAARYGALHARTVEHFGEAVRTVLANGGLTTAYPARVVAQLVLALESGRVLERAFDPAALPGEYLRDLVGRLVVPREDPR